MKVLTVFLFLFISVLGGGQGAHHGHKAGLPDKGIVPDDSVAIKIAEAVLPPIFGREEVNKFAPYHATLEDDVWTVYGTLKPNTHGGTPMIRLRKKDGGVIEVWFSQ